MRIDVARGPLLAGRGSFVGVGWIGLVVLALALIGVVPMLLFHRERGRRKRRLLDSGLDLGALVALLPVDLRGREYLDFAVSPTAPPNPRHELVGLIYRDDQPRAGNPPNVGLVIDVETRTALEIHADGIGLGYK